MKVKEIGVFDAKARLSELLDRVEHGAVYVITKRGRRIAELRPVRETQRLTFGCDAGRIVIPDSFDEPLEEFGEYTE